MLVEHGKSGGAGTAVAPTAASTTTTTAVQAEQTVPARTTFVVDGQKVAPRLPWARAHPRRVPGGRACASGALWNGMVTALGDKVFTCVFDRPGTTADAINEPPSRARDAEQRGDVVGRTLRQAGIGPRVSSSDTRRAATARWCSGPAIPSSSRARCCSIPPCRKQIPDTEWARIGFDGAGHRARRARRHELARRAARDPDRRLQARRCQQGSDRRRRARVDRGAQAVGEPFVDKACNARSPIPVTRCTSARRRHRPTRSARCSAQAS